MADSLDFRERLRPELVIIVDMDHTLLTVDVLYFSLLSLLKQKPYLLIWVLLHGLFGRPALKRAAARHFSLDVANLPVRTPLLDWLAACKAAGHKVWLVSAADHAITAEVAGRFSHIFDASFGSQGPRNLKGHAKAQFLKAACPGGFVYVGDSLADLAVWTEAEVIVLAGKRADVISALKQRQMPIFAHFP